MNIPKIDLYPYQLEIINAVTESVAKRRGLTFSVEIARQGGKNELSAWLEVLLLMYFTDEPCNIIKCAPTFQPQTMISMRRLYDRLDALNIVNEYEIEGGHIVRMGQSRVIFLSGAPQANVVGNTANLLLEVDEAQDINIEKFNRDFKPMAAVANATTILYGTPWHEHTLLAEVKQANIELEHRDGVKRHFRFDWQEVARHQSNYRSYVEGELHRLGENHPIFRTQYALLPVSSGGGLFSDAQLLSMTGSHPRCRTPRGEQVYIGGLDLGGDSGQSADSSVLTIAELNDNQTTPDAPGIKVVFHYAWTGLPAASLIRNVVEASQAWKLRRLAVDATGMGQPLAAMLRQSLGSRVVSVVFTRKSKSELGYELLAAAGTGRLKIYARDGSPESDECWHQLEAAAADYRPDRNLNFYVDPTRGHDDYLISLALTLKAASHYRPRAAFGFI